MFPLAFDYPLYADTGGGACLCRFTNPAGAEFGFCWGFLIWAFYFLTTFYFLRDRTAVKFL